MDGIPGWFILLFGLGIAYGLAREVLERRCPRCDTWFSRRTLEEEKFDRRGLIFKNPTKVRYLFQCDECGHHWEDIKDIDNDPGW
jgi:hypothetical protein